MFCEKCGAQIPQDSLFCEQCGSRIEPKAHTDTERINSEEDDFHVIEELKKIKRTSEVIEKVSKVTDGYVITPKFELAGDFSEGLAPVTDKNSLW